MHPSGRFYFTQNRGAATVSAFAVNAATGALIPVPGSPFVTNGVPNSQRAIVVSPTGRFLYVLVQPSQPSGQGQIFGFHIDDASGVLTTLQGSPFTVGVGNTGVAAFDRAGKFLYVTTSSPSVGALRSFSVDPVSGSLTQVGAAIPIGSYLDEIEMDPAGRFLYLADGILGSLDKIYSFKLLLTGVPELTGTIANGLHTVSPRVDPSGRFLYAVSDGTLRQYLIDSASGALTPIAGDPVVGGQLSYFDFAPDGKYLFVPNVLSNGIWAYSIDQVTGQLALIVGSPFISGSQAAKVVVDRAGKFLFAINQTPNTVSSFSIDINTGVLTSAGSFSTGILPVTVDVIGTQ